MTETRFFGFICHLPMPQQRCAEGLKTWFLWVLLHLFQYLPNSSQKEDWLSFPALTESLAHSTQLTLVPLSRILERGESLF